MSVPARPVIPLAEAVGEDAMLARIRELEHRHDRLIEELRANQREYEELKQREHFLVSEHERLRLNLKWGESR